jgi:hypothetical protein
MARGKESKKGIILMGQRGQATEPKLRRAFTCSQAGDPVLIKQEIEWLIGV